MRLWSLSPKYLDTKGLIALWRESLLAKAVLEGNTKGYTNHPQLIRFKSSIDPLSSINKYLEFVFTESKIRGYNFDSSKFNSVGELARIPVTTNQIEYEFDHLRNKLKLRDPDKLSQLGKIQPSNIETHPIFTLIEGEIEPWEVI